MRVPAVSLTIEKIELSFRLQSLHIFKIATKTAVNQSTMSLIPSFFGYRRSSILDPFSVDVWDPFNSFSFNTSQSLSSAGDPDSFANSRIDWRETAEAHVFKADLPGVKKEEVKVEVEEGWVLQISGERKREKVEKQGTWHRVERSLGRFQRRFRLPENAKVDSITAAMEDGVLTVTVPKAEEKTPQVKSIDISS